MKTHVKFFMLLFVMFTVPAFAIEFGSVLDEERVRILNTLMGGNNGQTSTTAGSGSSAGQTPSSNTAVEDAANPAASTTGSNSNSTVVNTESNVLSQDMPRMPLDASPGASQEIQQVPAVQEPSLSELRGGVQKYVVDASQSGGTFNFQDQAAAKIRKLVLIRVNDRMEKGVRGYTTDADFSDIETGELINLKFELFVLNSQINVIGIQMNTVNGQPAAAPVVENNQMVPPQQPQAQWPQELLDNQLNNQLPPPTP